MKAFWSWFVENEGKIREAYEAGARDVLDDLISPAVSQLSESIGWELGPYALPKYSFVFSPKRREDIPLARQAAEAAPAIKDWEIFCGKPPKDLRSLTFEVAGAEVCCDDWRYRMTSYNGGEFVDLEIFFDEQRAPPAGQEVVLCELAIEALVGQAVALERVGRIEHHSVTDLDQVGNATPLRYLPEHLGQVLSSYH